MSVAGTRHLGALGPETFAALIPLNPNPMPTLLRIDASSRLGDSVTRGLADEVCDRWRRRHPDGHVVVRDLVVQPIAHIADATIKGFYAETLDADLTAATALSDELIAELLGADAVVLGVVGEGPPGRGDDYRARRHDRLPSRGPGAARRGDPGGWSTAWPIRGIARDAPGLVCGR